MPKPSANKKTGISSADRGTVSAVVEVLSGETTRGGLGRLWPFLGPAFIASVASKLISRMKISFLLVLARPPEAP